jgi:hypothetical protein
VIFGRGATYTKTGTIKRQNRALFVYAFLAQVVHRDTGKVSKNRKNTTGTSLGKGIQALQRLKFPFPAVPILARLPII